MKRIFIITISGILFIGILSAQENTMSISGYVRNYTGLMTNDMDQFSIVQNTLNLNFERRGEKTAFKANPYLYQYFDKAPEIGLREIYMDYYADKLDIRIGKQQIIWGKAEGVFITDLISPKDLSEFLLRDFEEIRTGVTSVKINYHSGMHTLEGVWVPVFTPTIMPASGSLWAPVMTFPMTPIWDYSAINKGFSISNSDVFVRYSLMASAFDLELVGGRFMYDDPALHLTRKFDPVSKQLQSLTVRPEYHRVNMAGGSFSLPIGEMVIRGEGACYDGRYFQTSAPARTDATIAKNNLHYMAGLDFSLAGIKLSTQFIQERILDYEPGIQNDEVETTMTFLAKKDFLREKLWVELFAYVGLNNMDALIRPKLSYSLADGMEIQAGANIFTGTSGRFGQYDANDMLYTKIRYNF